MQTEMIIDETTITKLADLYDAAGVISTRSWVYGTEKVACTHDDGSLMTDHGRQMWRTQFLHESSPEVAGIVADLPAEWAEQVDTLLRARRQIAEKVAKAARLANLRDACEAVGYPAIKAYLLEDIERRGMSAPKSVDLRHLKTLASTERKFKAAYKPSGDCGARLCLKDAIHIGHRQEAYADNSDYAIPVIVSEGFDVEACKKNLWDFANACRTSNGLAGYGSTWTLQLIVNDAGVFVLADQRSSIAD